MVITLCGIAQQSDSKACPIPYNIHHMNLEQRRYEFQTSKARNRDAK